MKNYLVISAVVLFHLILISCDNQKLEKGNGNVTVRDTLVDGFNEIDIRGAFNVVLTKSDKPGVSIQADENLQQFITIEKDGDVLAIDSDRPLASDEGIKLFIQYKDLMAVNCSGAAVIKGEDLIVGDYLRVEMSGAGSVKLDVEVKALKINISGAGAVQIAGTVIEQNIQMSGAGGLKAYDLVSEKCKVDISGVGGAAITVKKELNATVSGVGGISYKGNPEVVSTNVSGLGTIKKSEDDKEPEEIEEEDMENDSL